MLPHVARMQLTVIEVTMISKKVLTILCDFVLGFLFLRTILAIIFYAPRVEYSKEIIPLAIGLIFISILGGYFKQKNWRIGCLMIGTSSVLNYFGMITSRELSISLHFLNFVFISIGLINFSYFYKSDFALPFKQRTKQTINNLIFPFLFLLFILIIFLVFGRN